MRKPIYILLAFYDYIWRNFFSGSNTESADENNKKRYYVSHGNDNVNDRKGAAAMNALGCNGKEMEKIAKNDKGHGRYNRYSYDENKPFEFEVAIISPPLILILNTHSPRDGGTIPSK